MIRTIHLWLTLALAVLAAGFVVRVLIFFHDCSHGTFFASRPARTILRHITGVLTFTSDRDWSHSHRVHHATAASRARLRGSPAQRQTASTAATLAVTMSAFLSALLTWTNPSALLGPSAPWARDVPGALALDHWSSPDHSSENTATTGSWSDTRRGDGSSGMAGG
jgi:hypothetical protein